MPECPFTLVDIIRHGEPVGGIRYRGHIDDPLSEKGWQQMHAAVADHKPWNIIVSSPMVRCLDFARELAQRHNIPMVIDERIKEISWGSWEGNSPQQLNQHDPLTVVRALRNPSTHRPSDAENVVAFQQRVIQAWHEITNHYRGQHILLVAHAGVIRAIMTFILHTPAEHMFRIHVPNASVTRIQIDLHDDEPFAKLIFHGGNL